MANTKKYVSLDKLGLYDEKIKKVITDGDAAALQGAKDYADGLAGNYDAAGAAATALKDAKDYTDAEATRAKAAEEANAAAAKKAQDEVDALELVVADKADKTAVDALAGKVGEVPEGSTVMGIIEKIQADAYDDTELRGLITGLTNNKADKTQVATDIETAVNAEKSARETAVAGVQGEVDALEQTHATDKKNLEDAIALKADITALNAVSDVANAAVKQADYDVKVKALDDEDARIAGLVATEQARAEGVEAGLDERLEKVEAFFVGAAEDEGEGENLKNALDTLVEIQTYIDNDGAAADAMVKDIAANKKAIEDHMAEDHDFGAADEALKAELQGEIAKKADTTVVEGIDGRVEVLEGEMDAVEGKVATLEGEMDGVQAAVATKAEAQDLTDAVAALEDADEAQVERIAALEAKFGGAEGSVEDMIADAKAEAIAEAAGDATSKANKALEDAKAYADAEDAKIEERVGALETASAKHALAADLTALDGRVTTAEGEIDTLQTEMDAVEALADAADKAAKANAQAIALKADITALNAVSDRVTTLETWHTNFVECSQEDINGLFA